MNKALVSTDGGEESSNTSAWGKLTATGLLKDCAQGLL